MTPSNVVFDIGGVLVDWQPHLAFTEALGSEAAARDFMERCDFLARNLRGDKGARFADLAAELEAPEDQALLASYVSNYHLTIQNRVPGTWELLDRLQTRGVPIHAITNWSAETWPVGISEHPQLGEVFNTLVVSGEEGMIKPERAIFDLFCQRAELAPDACVFIDDSVRNVEGARAAGLDAIHFTGAEALETALQERGLL